MDQSHSFGNFIEQYEPGMSLPQAFYTDAGIFAADLQHIYRRHWLLAGHTAQVPSAGDYFLFNVGNDSLIILRDDDGLLVAVHNTCRHRGSTICSDPNGNVGRLICPYHQWAYDRGGRLVGARSMGSSFDKSRFALHRAHLRTIEGLIYVCLADSPPNFEEAADTITRFLRPHQLDRTKVCFVADYEVRANWKLLVENNRECYHCAVGHPEFCLANYDSGMPGDTRPNNHYAERLQRMSIYWASHGLEVGPVNFPNNSVYRCARVPLRDGYVTESLDGKPLAPVMGELAIRDAGSLRVITFPNAWCHVNSDNANLTLLLPVGPQVTRARIIWLVREHAVEGIDYQPERVPEFWKITTEQDWKLCEDNQKGINSSRYQPGPLSETLEAGVDYFDRWYIGELQTGTSMVALLAYLPPSLTT